MPASGELCRDGTAQSLAFLRHFACTLPLLHNTKPPIVRSQHARPAPPLAAPSDQSHRRLSPAIVMLGLLMVSAGLRLLAARGDLWLDELWSLSFARQMTSPLDVWTAIHRRQQSSAQYSLSVRRGPPGRCARVADALPVAVIGERRGDARRVVSLESTNRTTPGRPGEHGLRSRCAAARSWRSCTRRRRAATRRRRCAVFQRMHRFVEDESCGQPTASCSQRRARQDSSRT